MGLNNLIIEMKENLEKKLSETREGVKESVFQK